MTENYDQSEENWQDISPTLVPIRVSGDDLLSVMGYEARCIEALAESIAFQISKDSGLPGPSAETHIIARMIASQWFYG